MDTAGGSDWEVVIRSGGMALAESGVSRKILLWFPGISRGSLVTFSGSEALLDISDFCDVFRDGICSVPASWVDESLDGSVI